MKSLPSLFLPHGAPDLPLTDHPARRFLAALGARLPRPAGVIVLSAHWESDGLAIGAAPAPATLHDFGGFPEALRRLRYAAETDPVLVARAEALLRNAGFAPASDHGRGDDRGVWVPLLIAYPDAAIPVVQLSLDRAMRPSGLFAAGAALAPLREEGVLLLGSGASVHNLRHLAPEGTAPEDWALAFDAWLADALARRDLATLSRFPAAPAEARRAHPTPEHFLPFFFALGAGWSGGAQRRIHQSYSYGSIGMAAFAFGAADEIPAMAEAA